MKKYVLLIAISFILNVAASHGYALYRAGFLYLDDVVYDYLDYQITSGVAKPDFVLLQPYDAAALMFPRKGDLFRDMLWKRQQLWCDSGRVAFQLLPEEGVKYFNDVAVNRYGASGGVHYANRHLLLGHRTGVYRDYRDDPQFAGDLSESEHWIYGRVNDAYMKVRSGGFHFFIGKIKRNWGPLNEYSLILSNHPYTYEHITAGYRNDWFSLQVLFSRLEDLNAYGVYPTAGGDTTYYYPAARKYLVGHRLDIRFSDKFQIGLSEIATYGGPDRDMEWEFLNPMTFYYGLQRNDRRLSNGRWTLDLFWRPKNGWAFYGQFMIDDVIVNNDPGVDDRARYPDRLAVLASLRHAGGIISGLQTTLTYARVWNRTYQSRWTYENYHYRGLGLGYPAAGLEELKLRLQYWGLYPFYLKNETILGRYGAVKLTDIFPMIKEPFPVGPVIHNLVNQFEVIWLGHPKWRAGFRICHFKDARHYLNRLNKGSVVTAELKVSYLLQGSLGR